MAGTDQRMRELTHFLFKAHPWHGISVGPQAPQMVTTFVEIVPADSVKYELDKEYGHLKVDRPQHFSSVCPTLYGFIPQTYCAEQVAARCMERTGRTGIKGDGDPLDICILSEKPFSNGNFLCRAVPVGGFRMIDGEQADDKIIAVLFDDVAFGALQDISEVPVGLVDRLRHYFLNYKQAPSEQKREVEIPEAYGRQEAQEVIRRSQRDYHEHYGDPEQRLSELRELFRSPR
jgi:inorganic pyrophosphatase